MILPYPIDPSLPSNLVPIFSDTAAARGDHLRANNLEIWANFASLLSAKNVFTSSPVALVAGLQEQNVILNSGSAVTVNLPAATGSGERYKLSNINSGLVSITPNTTNTIKGVNAAYKLYLWDCVEIIDSASGAWTVQNKIMGNSAATVLTTGAFAPPIGSTMVYALLVGGGGAGGRGFSGPGGGGGGAGGIAAVVKTILSFGGNYGITYGAGGVFSLPAGAGGVTYFDAFPAIVAGGGAGGGGQLYGGVNATGPGGGAGGSGSLTSGGAAGAGGAAGGSGAVIAANGGIIGGGGGGAGTDAGATGGGGGGGGGFGGGTGGSIVGGAGGIAGGLAAAAAGGAGASDGSAPGSAGGYGSGGGGGGCTGEGGGSDGGAGGAGFVVLWFF